MAVGDNAGHGAYTEAAQRQAEAVGGLKQVYAELAEQQIRDLKRVAEAQGNANSKLDEGVKGSRSLGDAIGALKGQLAALAAAAAAVAAAVKFVGDETARLDNIAKSAQKSGLGFEAYQRLSHVATLSGTSIESVSKASLKLNLNLREIADGGGKQAARALGELNLTADDLAGLSETEQFARIAGQLQTIGDESTRSALAFELFGKSGTELIPMLNAGEDGVRAMADAVGDVFTREQLAKAEAYQDSLANLNRSIDMAKGQLAVALAPAFQEVADSMTAGAGEASKYLPMLVKYLESVMTGIKPLVTYVKLFADQMAVVGRVLDLADGALQRAGNAAREFGADLLETDAGQWAIEAKDNLVEMAERGIKSITDAAKEHIPFAEDVARAWQSVRYAIGGGADEAQKFGAIAKGQKLLGDLLNSAKTTAAEQDEIEAAKLDKLQQQAIYAEHAVRLAEAQGVPARELEWLYRRQHAAKVDLLEATGKQAELEQQLRDEAVRQAAAGRRRGGGGRGPSDAERMQVVGEGQIQEWEARLRLAELEAELQGKAADEAVYLGEVRRNIAVQALELERQVLEVTKARNSVERERNANQLASIDASIRELELERQLADQAAARAEAQAWRDEYVASVNAESQALGNIVEIEDYKAEQRLRQLEDEGRFAEAYSLQIEQNDRRAEQMLAQLELERQLILMKDPQTEAERIQQQAELEANAHAQQMVLLRQESEAYRLRDAEQQRLFEAERKRKAAAWKQAQDIANNTAQLARSGAQLSSFIADATIRDEEKRARFKLRAEGIATLAVAAREQVNAVSAFAGLNIVQGLAHQAAAVLGFAQGGMMLAGQVPGGGGSMGGASASGGGRTPPRDRETSEAATTPDSVPAADRGPRRVGGRGSDAASQAGGTVININGFIGDVSQEGAEKLARVVRDARYGTELAG